MSRFLVQAGVAGALFIAFVAINFSLAKPAEICFGSDNCVVNCLPSTATLIAMCCENHCSPQAPTATCIQFYTATPGSAQTTCNCVESKTCQFLANQAFSNLAVACLLLGLLVSYFAASNYSKVSNFQLPRDDAVDDSMRTESAKRVAV